MFVVSAALLIIARRRSGGGKTGREGATAVCALNVACETRVIMPGVVLLRQALASEAQADTLRWCLDYGVDRKAWFASDGATLNAERQGRGRAYDAVERVDPRAALLSELLLDAARAVDPSVDPVGEPMSHVLLLYYGRLERGLGWHRDNGRIDGQTLAPVVSLSLGCACDFSLKHEPNDLPTVVRLDSGDAILFGGPARHVMHAVTNIRPGTCPSALRRLTSAKFANANEFRLNLTWRHAPELAGLELTDRFFHFGSPTRIFLDTQRQHGTEAAREEANERRRARQLQRKANKEKKAAARRERAAVP